MKLHLLLFLFFCFICHTSQKNEGQTTNDTPAPSKKSAAFDFRAKMISITKVSVQWGFFRVLALLANYFVESILFVIGMIVALFLLFRMLDCCAKRSAKRPTKQKKDS
jgi:hypothetical protein